MKLSSNEASYTQLGCPNRSAQANAQILRYLQRAVNRQPGHRLGTRRAGNFSMMTGLRLRNESSVCNWTLSKDHLLHDELEKDHSLHDELEKRCLMCNELEKDCMSCDELENIIHFA